ncbi:MAG: hypothetical protein PCFJNLEI_01557 [Verrucomicrobiae bacterium]|nr:hypothetical protein [Verrucomicrobiae bacterium]
MKIRVVVLAGLSLIAAMAQAERVIGEGDSWRYYKGSSTPPTQGGTNWTQVGFVDSTWGGPAPGGFGYGDADDLTVFSDMQNSYASVFIRRSFTITDTNGISRLSLGADYDDGIVVYLNGTEVARRNMPGGTVTHTTLASGNHEASRGEGSGTPNEKEFIALNPAVLLNGNNVLAVSGHNTSLGSSDFSLIVELYTNVTLVRGPFIQMPDADKVTVVWRTDALTDSAVDYGLTPAYEAGTVTDVTLVREHVVSLPGLAANTNYYYRVRSGGVTLSAGGYFRTKRTADQPFRFVVIGDFGQGSTGMTNIAARINERTDFDFKITVGDNVYGQTGAAGGNSDGAPGTYDPFWFKLYGPTMARVPTFVTLGNHDVDTANGQWSVDYFFMPTNGPAGQIEKNYSFQYGNAHCVVIDTEPFQDNQTAIINAIRTWVSNDLAAATAPWKFVFLHRPPWTSVGGHDDQATVKNNLTPLFAQFGVQIVFQGHNHWYERINAINGVYYVTSGACGAGLYTPSPRKDYSAVLRNDIYSYTLVDINGTRLTLQQFDMNGATIDEFSLEIGQPFKMDGLLDDAAWLRADNGLRLYAAIRANHLYVASQDAGEGGDNFIYLNSVLSTNRSANWGKTGTIMQWNAFVADENDNAFQRWYGPAEQFFTNFPAFDSMTSGLNNNGTFNNGVLEGTLDLANRFGTFPPQLHLAAAAYATASAGARTGVVPAGNDGNNVTNWLAVNTRDLALDLPVANAGTNQTREAGLPVTLNGTASAAPSGLPVSYEWVQLTGYPVALINSNAATAGFTLTTNLNTVLTFQLTVHDTRFASNATTAVTATEIVDTDTDGLTDQEELTGVNNLLTAANPNAQITDPTKADTDGDGMSDGAEALAGTNPNAAGSVLRVTDLDVNPGGFRLDWTAVPGKTYAVDFRDDAGNTWSNLTTVTATTSQTNWTDGSAIGQPKRFYRVRVEP